MRRSDGRGLAFGLSRRACGFALSARGLWFALGRRALGLPLSARPLWVPLSARALGFALSARRLGLLLSRRALGLLPSRRVLWTVCTGGDRRASVGRGSVSHHGECALCVVGLSRCSLGAVLNSSSPREAAGQRHIDDQLRRAPVPSFWINRHRPLDSGFCCGGKGGALSVGRGHRGQEDRTEGVHVASGIDRLPGQLLGRAIRRIGVLGTSATRQKLQRDARVGQDPTPARAYEDAVRLEVTGDEPGAIKGLHRSRDAVQEPKRIPKRERSSGNPLFEGRRGIALKQDAHPPTTVSLYPCGKQVRVPDGCPRMRGQLDPLSQLVGHLSGVVEIHGGRIGLRGCGRSRCGYHLAWARRHRLGRHRLGGRRSRDGLRCWRSRGGLRCCRRRLDRRWDCRWPDRTRRPRNPPRRPVGIAHRSVTAQPRQRACTTEVWRLECPRRRDRFHSDGGDHTDICLATRAGKLEGESEDPKQRKRARRGLKLRSVQAAGHVTSPELSSSRRRSPSVWRG